MTQSVLCCARAVRPSHGLDMPASIQGGCKLCCPYFSLGNCTLVHNLAAVPGSLLREHSKQVQGKVFLSLAGLGDLVCVLYHVQHHDSPSTWFTESCVILSSESLICSSFEYLRELTKCVLGNLLTYLYLTNREQSPLGHQLAAATQKCSPNSSRCAFKLTK